LNNGHFGYVKPYSRPDLKLYEHWAILDLALSWMRSLFSFILFF